MKYGDDKNGNPRTRGVLVKKFTGDNTGFLFPTPSPVRLVKEWPDEIPFTSKDFFRADEGDDENFYTLPRLVYHIDEPAVASLTQYYRNNISKGKCDRHTRFSPRVILTSYVLCLFSNDRVENS